MEFLLKNKFIIMKNFNVLTDNEQTMLTPPQIIKSLGEFDLDPCSPINRPWDTAKKHFNINDDGLFLPWEKRVWLNPPYDRKYIKQWLNKMALHQNGITLIFARTETETWQEQIFPYANSLFFIKGRLKFHNVKGKQLNSAPAPSVLISYTEFDAEMIEQSDIQGHHVLLAPQIFMFTNNIDKRTWRVILNNTMKEFDDNASLKDIYDKVLKIAPNKVKKNKHYKAKIRQVLQTYFIKTDRGKYSN